MHSTKKSIFKVSAFTIVIFILITTGCFFNQPLTPSTATEPANNEVRFTGTIDVDGMNSSAGRSAIAEIPSNIEYFVKAETTDTAPGQTLTVNVPGDNIDPVAKTFSINLKTGYQWKIIVGIKDTTLAAPDDVILSDFYEKTISATDTSIVHSFTLKPSISSGVNGSIMLDIYTQSSATLSITDEANTLEWNDSSILQHPSTLRYTLNVTSIPSGHYVLKLKFQKSGRKPLIVTQSIVVYDHMTTKKWVSGGNELINSSGVFTLTDAIYNASVNGQKNFYVDSSITDGDTNGTGESTNPFKTVAKAIGVITAIGDATSTYKVYAKAGGSESTSTRFTLNQNIDVVVYEDGEGKGPANPSGTYTVNFSGTSTLFTAKKSFSITGLNLVGPDNTADSSGVGLDSATSIFTMNSGEISKFRCGVWGGGYTDGYSTINLYGGKIFDNGLNTDTNTSGNAGCGLEINTSSGGQPVHLNVKGAPIVTGNKNAGKDVNINLISSSDMITVVGALTTGCDLGVSSNYISGAGNANARQITQGYQAKNGSDAPSSYFHGDKYAIGRTSSTSEVFLGQSGGSYELFNFDNISIVRADTSTKNTKAQDGTLNMEFKIMNGSSEVPSALEVLDITGYGSSFRNDAFYSTETRTGGGIKVSFKKDALPAGTYNLIVGFTDTDSDAKYDYSQKLVVTAPAEVGAKTFTGTAISGSVLFKSSRVINIKPLIACDHEVTISEYEKYCTYKTGNAPGLDSSQKPYYPVYNVSWYDAVMYCNLRSKAEGLTPAYYLVDSDGTEYSNGREISRWQTITGTDTIGSKTVNSSTKYYFAGDSAKSTLDYTGPSDTDSGICYDETANGWRLPTEAEWEYLARGGNLSEAGTTYSGNSSIDKVAWYSGNSGDKAHEICTKAPNNLGLYDMSGNIWEWCWDWYTADSNITVTTGASGPVSGTTRVFRGGGWDNISDYCKVNYRSQLEPDGLLSSIGFRVVRNAQ